METHSEIYSCDRSARISTILSSQIQTDACMGDKGICSYYNACMCVFVVLSQHVLDIICISHSHPMHKYITNHNTFKVLIEKPKSEVMSLKKVQIKLFVLQ